MGRRQAAESCGMSDIAYPDQTYGALQEDLYLARFTLERAFKTHLEPLIEGDAWRGCGAGFDDINTFMDSLRLDKFRAIAGERQVIVKRIKELQPEVSNRQIARTLGVDHQTVNNDLGGENSSPSRQNGNGTNEPRATSGEFSPTTFRTTDLTGNNEWYTPAAYIEKARRVLGGIHLDPASCSFAQKTVKATHFFTEAENGLAQPWRGSVWLNPPYAQPAIEQFINKLVLGFDRGRGPVDAAILLTNNSTDTTWFYQAAEASSAICFTKGRIRFETEAGEAGSPVQGQAFFYFGGDIQPFAREFSDIGFIVVVS
jgi:phage N-6-adenine-methyltransferase